MSTPANAAVTGPQPPQRTVLITGANGYIGSAVAAAFSRAGWRAFGLIRRPTSAPALHAAEVTPIIGSSADPQAVLSALRGQVRPVSRVDVFVNTTEDFADPWGHHNNNIALFRLLAAELGGGTRPLLIHTSGCKDYGRTGLHGSEGLAPHTEDSPLQPPPFAVSRCAISVKVLSELDDVIDAVTVRPTPLWGGSASFTKVLFEVVEKAKKEEESGQGKGLFFGVDPNTILHGCHIDDMAEAYVAIAEAQREIVSRKAYNVSAWRYETIAEVVGALAKDYGIQGPVSYGKVGDKWEYSALWGYSQWVGSDRIRQDLGWQDKRRLFVENAGLYRRAYEECRRASSEQVSSMDAKLSLDWGKQL